MSQQRRASDKLSRMRKQRDRIPKPGAIQQNVAVTVRLGMPPEHGRLNALWRRELPCRQKQNCTSPSYLWPE